MIDNNDVSKVEHDSIKMDVDSLTNLPEKIGLEQSSLMISALTNSLSNFQNVINKTNLSAVIAASNALNTSSLANLANLTLPFEKLSSSIQINKSAINAISEVVSSYNKVWSSEHLQAIQSITESAKRLIDSYQIDYSKIISNLSEVLKSLPSPYTKEEIEQITLRVKQLAEDGWVIYFQESNIYRRICTEDWIEIEEKWFVILRERLADKDVTAELQNSKCYSDPLIKSMVDSYQNKNFYAAYTLASLAIDGAINRVSEMISSKKKIPVGHNAVEEIDELFIDKSFTDIGLMYWLYNFFKDTKRFTIDEPNRHMIGHGRWEEEITEKMFLQLFNVILCINDEYDYWVEVIRFEQDNVVLAGG
ncbi:MULTISPECIES: hypothetical protein [Streptococcus]|uniref:Uncharacterized protein n=1 Tax=Streptococcus ruminantium TaxID=1917441 RepID=A0ABU1B5A0_9STRE|nr:MULTISPECIES: hypothetical protein [Streptococcus]MDQ8760026.1 hypothetical protein [Streptococcus ruminantium]MDQ8764705.1 hypothetical protein [Streptococcus ruminantium]MDQ8766829.1 hypothetical protein [Streptococcus ruminantium]MDQ8769466.1 hypothetical protein [Streptococcus ruminantium]MDQ8775238.1 hypothetical protein [Streptococcus ruminantium]